MRASYTNIRDNIYGSTSDSDCFRMATFAVLFTVGPEGFCPIFLLFGAISRPVRSVPVPKKIQRSLIIESSTEAVEKDQVGTVCIQNDAFPFNAASSSNNHSGKFRGCWAFRSGAGISLKTCIWGGRLNLSPLIAPSSLPERY